MTDEKGIETTIAGQELIIMGKIFWGFLFAFFDYRLTNGAMYINLLPYFIGCLLLGFGLRDLVKKNLPDAGYFAMAANRVLKSYQS